MPASMRFAPLRKVYCQSRPLGSSFSVAHHDKVVFLGATLSSQNNGSVYPGFRSTWARRRAGQDRCVKLGLPKRLAPHDFEPTVPLAVLSRAA
jgi:hypothetical protein